MNETRSNGYVIETSGLTKRYGKLTAVDNVSLKVKKGEIYGFLGLNGAGKTTTIRMLLGMIRPMSGEVRIFGKRIGPMMENPWGKTGYLVELPYSYPELTVEENLDSVRLLRGINDKNSVSRIIGFLKLDVYKDVKARDLSLGNNQRLGLAKAMIHDPEILILDEPSNSLDPAGIVEIRELLQDISSRRGVTIFISSHNLDEISRIATRIGIIHQGKLIKEIDANELPKILERSLLIDTRDRKAAAKLLGEKGYSVAYNNGGSISLKDAAACERPEEVNRLLVQAGLPPYLLNVVQEDLESYFLRTIGASK
jgi:ABC-2 type transport system ATP-binding protein